MGSLLKQINFDSPNYIIEEEEESSLFSPIHLGEIDTIEKTHCTKETQCTIPFVEAERKFSMIKK